MTDAQILAKVKTGLGITTSYQDELLKEYIAEVETFMLNAGVPADVVTSEAAVGCIRRGVADLWNYGSGSAKLSEYFKQSLIQLACKGAV